MTYWLARVGEREEGSERDRRLDRSLSAILEGMRSRAAVPTPVGAEW